MRAHQASKHDGLAKEKQSRMVRTKDGLKLVEGASSIFLILFHRILKMATLNHRRFRTHCCDCTVHTF